ncbi:hypothetical protein [Sphingorhabdus sp. EL138]|jgi:hypothetical protein|uniref:hypothetical protein n=1 Tax=Sphingorhabdus sp. EL138 TaxID=2073156 RepID=UPI0013A5A71D|nr:hypothetical protein [Sphingorhabdus sp. EL138]
MTSGVSTQLMVVGIEGGRRFDALPFAGINGVICDKKDTENHLLRQFKVISMRKS